MPCSMPRAGSLFVAALLLMAGVAGAGELSRPVPSDAMVTRLNRFNLRYSLRDVVADGVQKVEFYITEDMGRTWRLYGEDPDRMSPMTIEVPGEGVYGFVSIATDRSGNREREPVERTRPETVIVVDRTPPQAKWLSPTQNSLGRGKPIEFSWEASDRFFGTGPVKIQYAIDAKSNHDRDAVWSTAQENLSPTGTITWTPPTGASAKYNFRLIAEDRAGNVVVAYNPATVTVDSTPPHITSVSPLRSNKLENEIKIETDDGSSGSGVKEISLYTTDNGAGTWTLVKETTATGESVPVKREPGRPIAFAASNSGEYGLWPVVFDAAGNATPLPAIGVLGPYVMIIDTEAPQVTLSDSFLQGRAAVLANETRRVEWTAYDPHVMNGSGVISLSLDNGNTWQEIRSGLSATGSDIVNFPFGSQSEEAKLRVSVSDEFGNVGHAVSQVFKLSAADTVIDRVTPVQPGQSSGGVYNPLTGLYDDPTGTPPSIAPPPNQPNIYAPPQAMPPPGGVTTFLPPPDAGVIFVPDGGTQSLLPPSGQGISGIPADPYGVTPGRLPDESSANSLPRAMTVPSQQSPMPSLPIPEQPSSIPQAPSADWNPSPRAGTSSPAAPNAGVTPPVLPPVNSPFELGTPSNNQPFPPAAPTQPPVGQTGSGTASNIGLPPIGSLEGGPDVLPPPLPPTGAPSSPFPDLPGQGGASSLPDLGGDGLQPPPLAGPDMSAPPLAPTPTGAIPSQSAPVFTPVPTGPSGSTPLAESPQPTQPLPSFDQPDLKAPELGGPAIPARPANKRQLSEHYVTEGNGYLKDGRFDLAATSAKEAMGADDGNPKAYSLMSQVYVQGDPPDFIKAANMAKEATNLGRDWETWWNCADVYYRWAYARNKGIQDMIRNGQRPPVDLIDERNQALNNADIAVKNSAQLVQQGGEADRKKVAITQGLVAYLRALTIPEPVKPADASGPMQDEYRRAQATYKSQVTPVLSEAIPYFQASMRLGGAPTYIETFHLGIINFRLGGLEKDSGNMAQAATYYLEAVKYLEEATTAAEVPAGGPREAYYMMAYSYDILADQAGPNRTRYKELALRYWRQTGTFYAAGTPYRDYAEQRIESLSQELGQ